MARDRRRPSGKRSKPFKTVSWSLTTTTLLRGVRALSARDDHLAGVVERFGPPPLWARRPGFATLVRIILEQQVSLASGRAAYSRLQSAAGKVTPGCVARLSDTRLRKAGLTRQKATYCRNLATRIVDGDLSLSRLLRLDDHDARSSLLEVSGIGPWTADIYLLMALRRVDVWPVGDLALAKSAQRVKRLGSCPSQQRLSGMAEAWTPWRAVAARILWHDYLCNKKQATSESSAR